ncbi:MAG: PhzF family phenazine biosynthesis protein [Nitrospinota bacterium]|nr:PhzF family phenazine biosynthesis protein [Nitrospinota bacterium]
MKEFKFKKVDAFATPLSDGNPAAVVFLEDGEEIGDSEMQKIATELKGFVCEVAYVRQIGGNSFRLRYFSSEREVEFCGHATIATFCDLLKQDDFQHMESVDLHVNAGMVKLYNRLKEENAVFLSAPLPSFWDLKINVAEVANALGYNISCIEEDPPLKVVNGGLNTLLVPIKRLEDVLEMNPDFDTLNRYCEDIGIDNVAVYSKEVVDKSNRFRIRNFAVTFGYLEDPASGSCNSALGYYLLNLGLWDGEPFTIEQNGERERFNTVLLKTDVLPTGERQILIGGGAITRIKGNYILA